LKLNREGVPQEVTGVWWYIVVNFNQVTSYPQHQLITSCLRVGAPGQEPIAKAAACQAIGDVRIRRGVALFNGGYIECGEFNVGDARQRLNIPVTSDVKEASEFWMAVKGRLDSSGNDPIPLLRYEPVTPTVVTPSIPLTGNQAGSPVAVGAIRFDLAPITDTAGDAFITETPQTNLTGPGLAIAVPPAANFTGLFRAQSGAYQWYLGGDLKNREPVKASFTPIWIGESKLYIGGMPETPEDERFHGMLDVVAFDPKGGSKPG
jgi:hypothetical protein